MKRACLLLFGTLMFLGLTSGANAVVIDTVDATNGQADTYFCPAPCDSPDAYPYYRSGDEDWGWMHTSAVFSSITSATLIIESWDVDVPEIDIISGDGSLIGALGGNTGSWATTTIELTGSILDDLLDGSFNIWMDIDILDEGWAVTLASSTLTIDGVVSVPEPGTLGLLGLGLIGLGFFRGKWKRP